MKEHFFVIFAGMFWDISKIFLGGKNILKVLFYCFLYLGSDLGKAKLQRVVNENTKIRVWCLKNKAGYLTKVTIKYLKINIEGNTILNNLSFFMRNLILHVFLNKDIISQNKTKKVILLRHKIFAIWAFYIEKKNTL